MKKILFALAALYILAANALYSQKSMTSFCKYNFRDTQTKECGKSDTNAIFYKGNLVGYIFCEAIKQKNKSMGYKNYIFGTDMQKVAEVSNEMGGQLLIKYFNPYGTSYIKGMQFNEVIKQMVEKDKRLQPKQ